jgi:hypothetical protein
MSTLRRNTLGLGELVPALARRPDLWLTAARAGRSMVGRGWWRHRPFLPLPDPGWLHFRLVTAYGGDGLTPLRPHDVITWLDWCRRFPS